MGIFDLFSGGQDKKERFRSAQPEAIKAIRQFILDAGRDPTNPKDVYSLLFDGPYTLREFIRGFLESHAEEYGLSSRADTDRLIRRVLHDFLEPHQVDTVWEMMEHDMGRSPSRFHQFGLSAAKQHKAAGQPLSDFYMF